MKKIKPNPKILMLITCLILFSCSEDKMVTPPNEPYKFDSVSSQIDFLKAFKKK